MLFFKDIENYLVGNVSPFILELSHLFVLDERTNDPNELPEIRWVYSGFIGQLYWLVMEGQFY